METVLNNLENLFHEKIMLYQELVESLERERTLLMATDMDGLWSISEKKQDLVLRIEMVRRRILETLAEASIDYDMDQSTFSLSNVVALTPHSGRNRLRKAYLSIVNLKNETKQKSIENKKLVEQSLDFLDELISIIASTDTRKTGYNKRGGLNSGGPANLLLSREV